MASLPGEIRNIGVGTIRSKYYGLNGSVISDNNPRNCDFYVFLPQTKCGFTFKSYNSVAKEISLIKFPYCDSFLCDFCYCR